VPHAVPHTRCWSGVGLSLRNGWFLSRRLPSAHRSASEWQAVRVLNEAVQNGIRQRRVTSGKGRGARLQLGVG